MHKEFGFDRIDRRGPADAQHCRAGGGGVSRRKCHDTDIQIVALEKRRPSWGNPASRLLPQWLSYYV